MNHIKPDQAIMTKYINFSKCHMKFINDDQHFKTDFGYDILNIWCVKCRTYQAEYRGKHRDELREKQTWYYNDNKEELNKKNIEYNKVYHSEKVECNICGKTITRKSMFKHTMAIL